MAKAVAFAALSSPLTLSAMAQHSRGVFPSASFSRPVEDGLAYYAETEMSRFYDPGVHGADGDLVDPLAGALPESVFLHRLRLIDAERLILERLQQRMEPLGINFVQEKAAFVESPGEFYPETVCDLAFVVACGREMRSHRGSFRFIDAHYERQENRVASFFEDVE
jgi:hypothetical protein